MFIPSEEAAGNSFMCCHHEIPRLMKEAETEKAKILREFQQFYHGDIDIRLHENRHIMGCSLAADLLVNGEVVREYDPADLCFLDLNELMLHRLIDSRLTDRSSDSNA